ncbi:MAG: UDP-N-acetylmuramoyl-L-alanyl-D-glutamate--2,6-diaminopimelate ligase, partial [Alloprevotella sp.]|nr:UDP-N-acetylmuramoyl-L-alanyl-D-glutamate--2,6-diaminopimelate ligase [Alloprevotella sp.]
MKLKEVLHYVKPLEIAGSEDVNVVGVQMDSRKVLNGHLFVAVKGTQTDGHDYIEKAISLGASVIVHSEPVGVKAEGVTFVRVADTEDAVGRIATSFYGDPSRKLRLVGVTGTNGKTTIATVLYELFRKMGHKCGLLSTVCNYVDGRAVPASHTTPDPISLNELLGEMVEAGCEYAFMECSSHAIHQKRIGGLEFAGGIFTNLTRDHLDYHKTFENYRDAKKLFFDNLSREAFAIINADDRNGSVMVQNCAAAVRTYSTRT